MIKRFFIVFLLCIYGSYCLPSELVLIHTSNFEETKAVFSKPDITIHFYRDEFIIATKSSSKEIKDFIILDKEPWQPDISYYIVYINEYVDKAQYFGLIEKRADILYDGGDFLFVRTNEVKYGQLPPAKNDGMARIFNISATLPAEFIFSNKISNEPISYIQFLIDEVCGENITAQVQHLENYGTRDVYHPNSALAQEWIGSQFLSWGLEVEYMTFNMPGNPQSDNVIAILRGTEYPDEYIAIGAHYDSVSWSGDAPGADDNASGTSSIMEIARIMSQYEFKRSVIFCAFSGEEYGLYGSAAYAQRSNTNGKNIIGYFNLDMIGYLKPGHTTIMTSLIYPHSAKPLADFYISVSSLYFPDFLIESDSMTGGDSDHTSFNNNGYMAIWPFEDVNNYSPYIHTSDDIVGLSYNNENQAVVFTQSVLASVVTLANIKNPNIFINEISGPKYSKVYPNPAKNEVYVSVDIDNIIGLTINDISGKQIFSKQIIGEEVIDVSYLPKGIYFFNLIFNDFNEVHKVVIN